MIEITLESEGINNHTRACVQHAWRTWLTLVMVMEAGSRGSWGAASPGHPRGSSSSTVITSWLLL